LQKFDSASAALSEVNFNYETPSKDFDHQKVRGLVAKLIQIPEFKKQCSTAIEVTAGGKLYNVSSDHSTFSPLSTLCVSSKLITDFLVFAGFC
jgi:structural maintenance of chromosome 2